MGAGVSVVVMGSITSGGFEEEQEGDTGVTIIVRDIVMLATRGIAVGDLASAQGHQGSAAVGARCHTARGKKGKWC